MTLKSWLYILRDRNTGEYIYMDTAGNVTYTTSPTALAYTPDGWQKKSIAWERDLNKFGLVRTFTVNLNFVLDGKTLIDKIALQQSFESPIQLIIQKLKFNTSGNAFEYIDFYIGELNLTALESDEIKVSIPIVEGGISKLLKANESTVYEFEPNEVLGEIDGVNIDYHVQMTTFEGLYTASKTIPHTASLVSFYHSSSEQVRAYLAIFDILKQGISTSYNFSTSDRFFAQSSGALTVNIHWNFKGTFLIDKPGIGTAKILLKNQSGTILATPLDLVLSGSPQSTTFNIDKTDTITLSADDKLFLVTDMTVTSTDPAFTGFLTLSESSTNFSYKARFPGSYYKGLTVWQLFQLLVEKITGDSANASSTLLQANENLIITCGDAVRGLSGAKIKTSLADFYKFCKVVFCAGIGVEDEKIVIEEIDHFFKTTSPVSLGECRNFKWKFADDLLFNTIKIGWENKTSDNVNGKYIFNATHNYSIPITSVSKELELVTKYVADPFFIEIIRINLDGKTTTDSDSDNDIMVINTEVDTNNLTATSVLFDTATVDGAYINLNGIDGDMDKFKTKFTISGTVSNNSTFTVKRVQAVTGGGFNVYVNEAVVSEAIGSCGIQININTLKRVSYVNSDTGVPDVSTLFNIEYLSTKRILKRWMPYINSVLFQFVGVDLTFESTEKNRELKTDDGTTVIDEDSDEPIGGTRIFKALYYNLETTVDDIVPETLSSDPNSGFSVVNPVNGRTFTGILIKAAMAAEEQTAQSFRLLAGADEDENNLL